MKTNNTKAKASPLSTFLSFLLVLFIIGIGKQSSAQAITEIITDYNGYWKSAAASPNASKPDKAHNLLAFMYNGVRYSTGVSDGLLGSHNESIVNGNYWCLPVSNMTGTINANTKVGLGALQDGVYNGPSNPVPEWGIYPYLTDGIKGLGLGTCIANLPLGSMSFKLSYIQPSAIGDGVPDILVTQVADPAGNSFDRYEFTDSNGVRIGTYKDIVFTNIQPVGTWTADFYEATQNPLVLTPGFTQTDRPIRLWAADLSEFGVTAANCTKIGRFKINLCGNGDVAFVAYNNESINFARTLPLRYRSFEATRKGGTTVLHWQTENEQEVDRYLIERSVDGREFSSLGSVVAKHRSGINTYQFSDPAPIKTKAYYRAKTGRHDQYAEESAVAICEPVKITSTAITLWPNPAADFVLVRHEPFLQGTLSIFSTSGIMVRQLSVANGSTQEKISLLEFSSGTYFIFYKEAEHTSRTTLFIQR